jgi:transcriptional regulator with XRE-family HTH domain
VPRRNEPDELGAIIGDLVRKRRKRQGWSLNQLALHLEWNKGSVSNLEAGRVRMSVASLLELAAVFEVNVNDLLPKRDMREKWLARYREQRENKNRK